MLVLVACEESQRVCIEFRKKGHIAFSCDLLECSGGHPEWHIKGNVLALLNGDCLFDTQDGKSHYLKGPWDLIIAHPPCTRLCNSGQRWLYFGDANYRSTKIQEQQKAIVFFMHIYYANCEKIAIENPCGIMSSILRKPDCIYNPYDFIGETEAKQTCLWLKGLPPLVPTRNVPLSSNERTHGIFKGHFNGKSFAWNSPDCSRLRSRTPLGVAVAMAAQWG